MSQPQPPTDEPQESSPAAAPPSNPLQAEPSDVIRLLLAGSYSERAEIVIGLVGALGTDLSTVESVLKQSLASVGYSVSPIRVSKLIDHNAGDRIDDFETAIDRLMDAGDVLRRAVGHGSAAARLAIAEMIKDRDVALGDDNEKVEREAHATIIRQLKHPEEVRLLRSVYGPRFVLIGAWSPLEERKNAVLHRLERDHPGEADSWYAGHQSRLMTRDEKDEEDPLGQRVRSTFELADAYLALMPGVDLQPDSNRLIRLLFGAPFETPRAAEQAMYQAWGARLRSSAAGRQVGAIVTDTDGELLATGTNEVPKAGGGQYWPTDEPDYRDFRYGFDINDRQILGMLTEIFHLLQKDDREWLGPELQGTQSSQLATEALQGPLKDSRLASLLEFGRIAHAEMAAICTAARRGVALGGQTMYTTTYPCHECARLIIATGIARVIYIDPYTKSQVQEMYRHEVAEGPYVGTDKVVFEPFSGIAPQLYQGVFTKVNRDRDPITGDFVEWNPGTARPRLVAEAEATSGFRVPEDSAVREMTDRLIEAGWVTPGEIAEEQGALGPAASS